MLLKNEFSVDTGIEETWALLTDLERIAPCMPGASLQGREGEDYLGSVKIKVGPIGAAFSGKARFTHKDDAAKTAVISAAGKDPKGQAAANAQIHARLESESDTRTKVIIDTELDVSGRMAQFGRGAIADVSNRLIGQFTDNLSREIANSGQAAPQAQPAVAAPTADAGASQAPPPPPQYTAPSAAPAGDASLDAFALVMPMIKERYGQAIIGGVIGAIISWIIWGRKVK